MMPALPLPPLRPPMPAIKSIALPGAPQPTTDELLDQMVSVLYYGELHAATWQARRRGCKDYGEAALTARQAMLNALKVGK